MSQESVTLRFDISRAGEPVRTEQFDQNVVKIGKLASSHLRLEDPDVSRIHAVIEQGADGSFSVIDLGSASGTFLNGDKVTKAELSDGDELRLGETTIQVRFVSGEEEATTAAGATDGQVEGTAQQQGYAPIELEDGTVVEPYTQLGYYDEHGNYICYWYDEQGQYHPGYGYYDEEGQWQVAHGYYDPQGEWIATEEPVSFVGQGQWSAGPSNAELYEEEFFAGSGGDTLEVAMLWADQVLSVTSFRTPRTVTIGPDEQNDFLLEDGAFGEHISVPLVVARDGAYALVFTESMNGFVQKGDQHFELAEAVGQGIAHPSSEMHGAYEIPLDPATSARVDVGATTFLIHFTKMPAVLGGGFTFDTTPVPYIALSAIAHLVFLFLAMTLPDDARGLDLDDHEAEDRFVEMMSTPEQEEEEDPEWLDDDKGDEKEAAKHKGEQGEAGKEDSEQTDKKMEVEGDAADDPELKKKHDTKVAKNAGVEDVFNSEQVSSMWGGSDESVGSDAQHALGNLDGQEGGEAKGFGGLGIDGAGQGGGGDTEDGIGMANVGTAGRGGGGEGGDGYGKGKGDLGDKEDAMPQVVPEKPAVEGSLDKEIIRRVVRQHRREVSACYERELQKDKSLSGRVKVKFIISANGSVMSSQVSESTLKNSTVENCIAGKIRQWAFPEPEGGGIVEVNYPFNFSRQ